MVEFNEKALREEQKKKLREQMADESLSANARLGAKESLAFREKEDRENSAISKFRRGVSTAAKVAGGGAAAAGRGVAKAGRAASSAGNKAQNIVVNAGDQSNRTLQSAKSSFSFFMIAIIFHAFDVFSDFNRKNNVMFGLYLLLAAWAYFGIFKNPNQAGWRGFRKNAFILAITLSAISFFITWWGSLLQSAFPTSVWIEYLILFFPIWPMYMIIANPQGSNGIRVLGNIWMIFWIIFILIVFLTSMKGPADYGVAKEGLNIRGTLLTFWNQVRDTSKRIWRGFLGLPPQILDMYNRTKYEQLYIGTVEENQGVPLGIYVKDFGPATGTRFFANQSVLFTALIQGATFLDQEPPILESHCLYQPFDADPIYANETNGDVYPASRTILFMEPFYVDCMMPEHTFTKKGSYTVTYRGVFDFHTWAYSTWVFVDENTRMSYIKQGLDINEELSIPKQIETFFTDGPANIGMSLLELPISVNRDKPENSFIRFAASISNKEPNTMIHTIKEFHILTPKSIKLKDCSKEPVKVTSTEEYNNYTFDYKFGDVKEYHTSVSCWLDIKKEDVDDLLGDGPVAYKTFVVEAYYVAQVEETSTIRVEN